MVHSSSARHFLTAAVLLLSILSLLPLPFLGWVRSFHNFHTLITAPISSPISNVSRWALPAKSEAISDEAVAAFEERIESLDAALKRTLIENQRLRAEMNDLRVSRLLNPGVSFDILTASVIGTASDLSSGILRIKAGSRIGVSTSTVATGPGLQLVGKVTGVSSATCIVVPITARNAGSLKARVMFADLFSDPATSLNSADGLACTLSPVGDGTLMGPVEDRRLQGSADPIRPRIGQLVRLDDPGRWPSSAQMTLVGVVERVEPNPDQPLRSLIIVRPRIDRLDRLAELTLRIQPDDDASAKTNANTKNKSKAGAP